MITIIIVMTIIIMIIIKTTNIMIMIMICEGDLRFWYMGIRASNTETDQGYGVTSQPAITCSKLTIETLEQGVKYIQS